MSKKFIFVNPDGDYQETPGAFEEADFVNASAGVGDAGKPIVLNAAGEIDSSMLATIDHGDLDGLADGVSGGQYLARPKFGQHAHRRTIVEVIFGEDATC